MLAGWPKEKIVPFGYFPPALEGAHFVERVTNTPFVILATGELSKYRGADVLMDALVLLKKKGVPYKAVITQTGELLPALQRQAKRYDLPVEFAGLIPMSDLIALYEQCTVYVAAGRHEPWGMRLNDALNCGAPLVVSRGMGGVKMVDDYGCGLSFRCNDAMDLTDKLSRLATDRNAYIKVVENVKNAVAKCSPQSKGRELISML